MKKVLLMMVAFATISFGLVSCGDDPVEPTPATCDACGTYNGNFNTGGDSATILIAAGVGLDNEVLDDTPFSAVVTEGTSADKLNMLVTLQVTVSGTAVPVPVDVVVNYDAAANTFAADPNVDYTLEAAGIPVQAKLVSMAGSFSSNTSVTGTIVLTDHSDNAGSGMIDATFLFDAAK